MFYHTDVSIENVDGQAISTFLFEVTDRPASQVSDQPNRCVAMLVPRQRPVRVLMPTIGSVFRNSATRRVPSGGKVQFSQFPRRVKHPAMSFLTQCMTDTPVRRAGNDGQECPSYFFGSVKKPVSGCLPCILDRSKSADLYFLAWSAYSGISASSGNPCCAGFLCGRLGRTNDGSVSASGGLVGRQPAAARPEIGTGWSSLCWQPRW